MEVNQGWWLLRQVTIRETQMKMEGVGGVDCGIIHKLLPNL
jgi:hypothetical protein